MWKLSSEGEYVTSDFVVYVDVEESIQTKWFVLLINNCVCCHLSKLSLIVMERKTEVRGVVQ